MQVANGLGILTRSVSVRDACLLMPSSKPAIGAAPSGQLQFRALVCKTISRRIPGRQQLSVLDGPSNDERIVMLACVAHVSG